MFDSQIFNNLIIPFRLIECNKAIKANVEEKTWKKPSIQMFDFLFKSILRTLLA